MLLSRMVRCGLNSSAASTARRRHFRQWMRPADPVGVANLITHLGNVSAELPVPEQIARPDYYYSSQPAAHEHQNTAEIHTADGIRRLRSSCRLAAEILQSCEALCQPGEQYQ